MSREVLVGRVGIGGKNPIRIQSMTKTKTADVLGTLDQVLRLQDVGCEIVRITVPGSQEVLAISKIKELLEKKNCNIPLVADTHFHPRIALEVIEFVDKVRINPGNYVRGGIGDDALNQVRELFFPLVERCKVLGKSLRIGVNHGSLSERMVLKYGDTIEGMVESAIEFGHLCRELDFHNFIFSLKSSNTFVMVNAYRLLDKRMHELGWDYPLHLGVTEAGNGLEGRVRSAIGMGALLLDGIGDTIRFSLTEDPWFEIDPCQRLIKCVNRFKSEVQVTRNKDKHSDMKKGFLLALNPQENMIDVGKMGVKAARAFLEEKDAICTFDEDCDYEDFVIFASALCGPILLDKLGSGLYLKHEELAKTIAQAAKRQNFKAEIISCPGCGRTLFDIQKVKQRITEKLGHLKDVKIAVMGCIVNGPGEMADADFGYIGAGSGKVDLYIGAKCVERGINELEADEKLIKIIEENYAANNV